MCTELLPPGGYPIAVKYIVSYIFISVGSEKKLLKRRREKYLSACVY
jgi:hypothetical protein